MQVIQCNQPTFFDVDDTLVMWNKVPSTHPDAIKFICPAHRHKVAIQERQYHGVVDSGDEEVLEAGQWEEYLLPHKKHIEQLKAHKARGHTIVVWSAGGWQWALAVVQKLGIEMYVDVVMEKPRWAYDDLPAERYMPKSQYLPLEDKKEE